MAHTRTLMSSAHMPAYFSPDYCEARTRFRQRVQTLHGHLESWPIAATGPRGERLTIDVATFGADVPRRLLLHSSGLHGVEGFTGSAIQLQLLAELPPMPEDTALVLVHILNPYGMAWLRRVNAANVDLNRNGPEDAGSAGAPAAYARYQALLNPPTPPSRDGFVLRASWLILRYGFTAVKQAVAGGQYASPHGLFYGGTALQPELVQYRTFLEQARFRAVERVLALDVHTGLGPRGTDTLLVDAAQWETMRQWFGPGVRPLLPDRGPAYQIRGGLQGLLARSFADTQVACLGQEFGTYGPLRTVHALREENRWHHWGRGTLEHPVKARLKEVFNPEDVAWRQSVLARGRALVQQALATLAQA
jgi:hypothetical protein